MWTLQIWNRKVLGRGLGICEGGCPVKFRNVRGGHTATKERYLPDRAKMWKKSPDHEKLRLSFQRNERWRIGCKLLCGFRLVAVHASFDRENSRKGHSSEEEFATELLENERRERHNMYHKSDAVIGKFFPKDPRKDENCSPQTPQNERWKVRDRNGFLLPHHDANSRISVGDSSENLQHVLLSISL